MIGTLIKTWLAPYEVYIWAGLAVLALGGILYETHVQRDIGRKDVIAADAAARADEHKKIQAAQKILQAKADKAEADRVATEEKLADYQRAHPVGSVWLCGAPNDSAGGVRPSAPKVAGPKVPGTGPAAVPEVSGRSDPPRDVGPQLNTLVSAASKLAGLYREAQSQPEVTQPK